MAEMGLQNSGLHRTNDKSVAADCEIKWKGLDDLAKDDYIRIKNARIHNLKGIDVSIPKHRLTVITGVSGSGKSSLAFDTLYEEGKRRYLMFSDTQFMIDAVPGFDSITGLSPAVAVEQRIIRQSNPRSTVGTRIKISHLLAALFANYGKRDPAYDDGLPLEVSMFQRGSAKGMCVKCLGKGTIHSIDETRMFADREQLVCDIACGLGRRSDTKRMVSEFCTRYGLILSRLVDTFFSRVLYPMLLLSENHSIAAVLSWEEDLH